MSPFSKVEMSPFVVLKWELQHERYGAGGAPTTLSYNNVIYQIKTKRSAYTMRQAQVEVRERHTGEITIEYKQRPLEYTIYSKQEQQQGKVIEAKLLQPAAARAAARPKQERGPVPSTPWRRFYFSKNSLQAKERRGELCILRK